MVTSNEAIEAKIETADNQTPAELFWLIALFPARALFGST